MKEYINYYCSLRIYSQKITGNEMVDIIGIKPTKFWNKGEPIQHGKMTFLSNGYIIDFYENKINKIEERSEIDPYLGQNIKLFLDKLLDHKKNILKITKTEEAYISIGISKMGHHIGIKVDTAMMKKLLELNLTLDYDIHGDD